jgi:hypothetical protein
VTREGAVSVLMCLRTKQGRQRRKDSNICGSAKRLEAEALWGADIRESTQALRTCATTLFVSIEAIVDDKAAGGDHFRHDVNFGRLIRANAHAAASATDNALSKQIPGMP